MQVGFAVVIRGEAAEIQFYGRRPNEPRSLVAHTRHGRRHAVLMGRLTYRSELLARLPPELAAPADDAALALAAYRHWGPQGLARLEGCFALAIWDGDEGLLLGARDPFGGYPLFWTRHPDGVACGTVLPPLLRLLPSSRLSLDYLAEFLSLPGGMVAEPLTRQSVYEGIFRVAPGGSFEARTADGQVRERRHWDWLERMVDPGSDRLEELAELVQAGLRRAVTEQLRGVIASHVSGGMGSTAVALLARDWLRNQPGQPPVHAISATYERLGGLDRETPYVEAALARPGLVPHRVPADGLLDYDGFADPPRHDEPCGGLFRMAALAKLVDVVATAGADTLLTGEGADALVDQRPHWLADLLRHGRLWSAWREARAWGRAYNRSAWHYLWAYGLAHLAPAAWLAGPERQGPGNVAPWIRPDFARAHGLRQRELRYRETQGQSATVSAALSVLRFSCGDGVRWYAAAPLGVALVHPFLDPRFVGLCLGIQARYRQRPGGQKPLLAQAVRDVLPEAIRLRRRKSHYNAIVHAGLARNLPVVEGVIRDAPDDCLGVFDRAVMLQSLQEAAVGYVPSGSLDRMNLSLSWLKWCSLQGEWQRPLEPVARIRVRQAVEAGTAHGQADVSERSRQ
jgi:asparagine synthase (glutamine-hydrolysing)